MRPGPHVGCSLYMSDPKSGDTPDKLREKAERCFRLAYGTTDEQARATLITYGDELLAKAKALEDQLIDCPPIARGNRQHVTQVEALEGEPIQGTPLTQRRSRPSPQGAVPFRGPLWAAARRHRPWVMIE